MNKEERETLKQEIREEILLSLPSVIGNLITNHVAMVRVNRKFYEKHPDLREHKDVVASIIEDVEGINTFSKYEEVLEKSIPKIKEAIKLKSGLDMDKVSRPDRKTNLGDL